MEVQGKTLQSNAEVIYDAHESGELLDVFNEFDTDDLILLRLEVTKGRTIAEIMEAGAESLVGALSRLGWSDNLVKEIEARR